MSALEFDMDEFYDEPSDEYRPETLAVQCPDCGFTNHPLPGATVRWTGWRWMGVSHQEPQTDYRSACAACNRTIDFTVRSPQ